MTEDRERRQEPAAVQPEKKTANPKNRKGLTIFARITALCYMGAAAWLAYTVYKSELLPLKLLQAGAAILAAVSILLILLLSIRRVRPWLKVPAILAAIALIGGCGYVVYHLNNTLSFFSQVTKVGMETETFYAVVKKDGGITKAADLKSKTVSVMDQNDPSYQDAEEQMNKKSGSVFSRERDISAMARGLMDGSKEILLLSKGHYEIAADAVDGFRAGTVKIAKYTVDIPLGDLSKDVRVTKEPFNIYISGMDEWGDISQEARSDVNMIVTVNPRVHKILLTSIPRDTEIRLTERDNALDKLTHTGVYGISQTLESVEDLTGLEMNYYVKVDYSTLVRLIDAMGGIDVVSDYEFDTSGQRWFHFKKGKNHLNGRQALAFSRERHAFEDGDLQRNVDQMKVMEAILKKATSSKTILSRYSRILKSLEGTMQVNMTQEDISSLIRMQLDGMEHWDIQKESIRGVGEIGTCYSMGNASVFLLKADQEDLEHDTEQIRMLLKEETEK